MSAPGPDKGTAAARPGQEAAPGVSPRYIWTMLGSILGCFVFFYVLLSALSLTGNLPPPSFANSLCVDEKLANLRERPAGQPNLLVIGSSVAWRHFDGDAVKLHSPDLIPLNGAFCGLTASQSIYAGDWLMRHYPSIREVLMIAGPQDFQNCTTPRTAVFDSDDADDYVFGRASPWSYYIKYFAPAALLRSAAGVAARRTGENTMDPLVFDRYGSGPLDTQGYRDTLLYGAVDGLDQACFDALSRLAIRLRQEGRRLMVASTPMHPEWKALYDPGNRMKASFNLQLRKVLDATHAEFWDGDGAKVVGQDAFYDGIHLRWSAVAPFSEALARRFRFGLPPAVETSNLRATK
jgi:hypothetical protein